MSETNTTLVSRYYDALNNSRWAEYEDLFSSDASLQAFGGIEGTGPDAMRSFDQVWKNASSDFSITPLFQAAEGDRVLCEILAEGVHDGVLELPTGPVAATGNEVGGKGVGVFQVRDGRIVAQRIYFDRMIIAEQLGLLPDVTVTA